MSGLEVDEEEVETSTTDIIQAIDVDSGGGITMVTTHFIKETHTDIHQFKEEFVEHACKSQFIASLLDQ